MNMNEKHIIFNIGLYWALLEVLITLLHPMEELCLTLMKNPISDNIPYARGTLKNFQTLI